MFLQIKLSRIPENPVVLRNDRYHLEVRTMPAYSWAKYQRWVEVLGCYGGFPVSGRCNPVLYSTFCERFGPHNCHKRNIPSFLRCRQSFGNASMILWGFQNHHFESTYSCQIRNPTVFDIRCNDIDTTKGVLPWSDNGPHRIDNFPLKNGSCWSLNGCVTEGCGFNDFPVNVVIPVFLKFVEIGELCLSIKDIQFLLTTLI